MLSHCANEVTCGQTCTFCKREKRLCKLVFGLFCISICNSIYKHGCLILQGKKENWGYLALQGPLDLQVWRENQVSRDSLVYRVHQVHQDYQVHLWKVLKVALVHQVFQEGQVRAWPIPINICQYFHILLVGYQPLNFLNLFGWISSRLMAEVLMFVGNQRILLPKVTVPKNKPASFSINFWYLAAKI